MPSHVDLVENRWSAGYQERVGSAYRGAHGVEVDAQDQHYREIVLRGGEEMSSDPDRFLEGLSARFHSDYFFATELHDETTCPFADGDHLPFRRQPVAQPAESLR
jgi:hypothetical protein